MIDWKRTQANLKVTADGIPGEVTWTALLRVIASPKAKPAALTTMARVLRTFGEPIADLSSPARVAGYVSNTGNETGGFADFDENLNYSAERMAEVWPSRYRGADGKPNAKARALANSPVAFANDVYGARMGNELDGTNDNDGYDFRGLGPLATTGYNNFLAAERLTGIPFSTQPGLMADPGIGTLGALAWWAQSGINAWLDKGNPTAARSVANAGHPNVAKPEGIETVLRYNAALLKVLA